MFNKNQLVAVTVERILWTTQMAHHTVQFLCKCGAIN